MFLENADRGFLIYELWEKGLSIDSISLKTGIPRSTVGYYVRKFNKAARRGEPITFPEPGKKRDEKAAAVSGFIKAGSFLEILEMLKRQELDKVYKLLSIMKLLNDLQRYVIPSAEEREAFNKNTAYVLEQYLAAGKFAREHNL